MSPPCTAMLLETGDWSEFWYQRNFRNFRLDIAYKISVVSVRTKINSVSGITAMLVLCPCSLFSSATGEFMKLRVPLHSGYLHNTQQCICNDWSMPAKLTVSSVGHWNSRVGLHFLILTSCMGSIHEWPNVTKWMTYTTKFFWSTFLIGRVVFLLRLWCFKGTVSSTALLSLKWKNGSRSSVWRYKAGLKCPFIWGTDECDVIFTGRFGCIMGLFQHVKPLSYLICSVGKDHFLKKVCTETENIMYLSFKPLKENSEGWISLKVLKLFSALFWKELSDRICYRSKSKFYHISVIAACWWLSRATKGK